MTCREDFAVPLSVADPIFTAMQHDVRRKLDLFQVLTAASTDRLIDLPMMAAHQRLAVVTVLAILSHLLRRYASINVGDTESWAAAWAELVGPDALRLSAPPDEVAFMQPPTALPTSQQSIESADLLIPKVEHEVKQTWQTTAESALFAIMGSSVRPNVKDHRSASRVGMTAILTSLSGTLGEEVAHLATAYDSAFVQDGPDYPFQAHLVWLRPYQPDNAPLSLADIPRPFIDVGRAQRLTPTENGRFEIWASPNNKPRIDATSDPWLDDPHTPKIVGASDVKRHKLGAKTFDHRFEHEVLFGGQRDKQRIVRPRILDLTDYRIVRLCALGTDQGKTKGYREAVFVASPGTQLFSLDAPASDDRPARLSRRALETVETGQSVLRSALFRLFSEAEDANDTIWARINRVHQLYKTAVGPRSVQFVFDTLGSEENLVSEQQVLDQLVAEAVIDCFGKAASVLANPLQYARAEQRLRSGVRSKLRGASVTYHDDQPMLARQTYAILEEMMRRLAPDDRAQLRTMSLSDPPLSFWKLLPDVPAGQLHDENCIAVWKVVLRAMGRVAQSNRPLGRVLRESGFPEARLSRLLVATGPSLPGFLDEVARWLITQEVVRVNLAELAVVGLGDALDDYEARNWARRSIALQYVREPNTTSPSSAPDQRQDRAEVGEA